MNNAPIHFTVVPLCTEITQLKSNNKNRYANYFIPNEHIPQGNVVTVVHVLN